MNVCEPWYALHKSNARQLVGGVSLTWNACGIGCVPGTPLLEAAAGVGTQPVCMASLLSLRMGCCCCCTAFESCVELGNCKQACGAACALCAHELGLHVYCLVVAVVV
jgi:hypothetical protein